MNHSLPTAARPGADPTGSADSAALPAGFFRAAFLAVFGFMLVVLNWLVDAAAIDITLVPRLLAAQVFLVIAVAVVSLPAIARHLDTTILRAPLVRLYGGYLLVSVGSLVAAVNVSAGFTDVFRTLATFVTLCLFCLLLPTLPGWRHEILRVLVVAGGGLAAVGVYEIGTILGPGIHGRHAMERITGLMSSVNLYAGMLALVLPWCLCGATVLRGAWRVLAAFVSAAVLAVVFLLQSRAAWLAVLVGGGTAVAVLLARPADFGLSPQARRRLAAACVAALGILAAGIALAPADNPFAQRFRSIFASSTDPAAPPREGGRLMIWGITARMIADHSLTGVGAGNFTVRLHEYFGDDDLDFSNVHTNWVQPHNDFLWVFVEKGVLGILLFAGCFIAAAAALVRVLRDAADPTDRWLALGAAAGLASYATLSCFDFPLERMNHQVMFALVLAVATVLARSLGPATAAGRTAAVERAVWSRRGPLAAAVVVAVLGMVLGVVYARAAIRQEKEVILARRAWRQGRFEEMLAAARRARTPWKTLDPLVSPVAFLEGMAQIRLGHVDEGIACLEQARVDNPNRMYVVNNLGILYAGKGRFDEAIECFGLVAERYPHRIEPFNNLAGCLIETGHPQEAIDLLEQIPEELRTKGVVQNLAFARERAAMAEATQAPVTDAAEPAAARGAVDGQPAE